MLVSWPPPTILVATAIIRATGLSNQPSCRLESRPKNTDDDHLQISFR
jgi:hypothetical protein